MSQYCDLFKSGLADFNKVLLEKYSLIGLDEVDAIVLIKLKSLLDSQTKIDEKIIVNNLVKSMSISKAEIEKRLVNLIVNQYINVSIIDGKETYALEDLYKRLGNVLEHEDINKELNEEETLIQKVTSFIEKEMAMPIKPIELQVIKHWIDVDKYSFSEIKEATLESLKLKKRSVKYIDAILSKKKPKVEIKNNETDIEALFKAVYERTKK